MVGSQERPHVLRYAPPIGVIGVASIAIGFPVHGSRSDVLGYLAEQVDGFDIVADLGHIGVDDVTTGTRQRLEQTAAGRERIQNASLCGIRARSSRRSPSEELEGFRVTLLRGPFDRFANVLRAVTAVHYYKQAIGYSAEHIGRTLLG